MKVRFRKIAVNREVPEGILFFERFALERQM